MKHTPGPWEWQFEDDATMLRSIETDDLVMAEYFGTGHPETFMPDGMNADLIATAPEMYEALEWLLNLRSGRAKGGDDFSANDQWDDAWDSAIKAIQKARGEGE